MVYRIFIRERKTLSEGNQYPNPWQEIGLGEERPVMVYAISDLNKLEDRRASFSQAIRLPKSNRNCAALGFIDEFSVVAEAAYTPREVLLTCDDMRLTPEGALLHIINISKYIECQIVSGATDLFKSMDKAIDPLVDWDAYNYSLQGLQSSYTDRPLPAPAIPIDRPDVSVKHRWPIIFPYKGAAPRVMPTGEQETISFWGLVPCVQFLDLIRFLLRREGFRFYSDLIGDPEVEKDYITDGALPKSTDNYNGGSWSGRVAIPVNTMYPTPINPGFLGTDYLKLNKPTLAISGNQTMEFNAPNPGTYSVTLTVDNSGNTASPRDLSTLLRAHIKYVRQSENQFAEIDLLGTSFSPASIPTPSPNYIYTFTEEVKMSPRDQIMCTLTSVASGSAQRSPQISFSVQLKGGQDIVAVGTEGSFLRDTGFKSGLEAMQAFVRAYGALIEVKYYPRIEQSNMYRMPDIIGEIRVYSYNELYRRRDAGVFYDWSGKVVIDEDEEFAFKVGDYAQINHIELVENTDDDFRDSGSIPVNNGTLPAEKTLFTIPIEAGKDVNGFASIPVLAATEETLPDDKVRTLWNYDGSKPHLVRIDDNEQHVVGVVQGINYGSDTSGVVSARSTVIARHRSASYLIDNHYAALSRMLHNAKKIRRPFNLDSSDIEGFDFFTPVYIEYFGAYFYVLKIDNFIAGRLTMCELVRL